MLCSDYEKALALRDHMEKKQNLKIKRSYNYVAYRMLPKWNPSSACLLPRQPLRRFQIYYSERREERTVERHLINPFELEFLHFRRPRRRMCNFVVSYVAAPATPANARVIRRQLTEIINAQGLKTNLTGEPASLPSILNKVVLPVLEELSEAYNGTGMCLVQVKLSYGAGYSRSFLKRNLDSVTHNIARQAESKIDEWAKNARKFWKKSSLKHAITGLLNAAANGVGAFGNGYVLPMHA
ncbi:hypothetical protein QR680_014483 [Steinernema hermaphroditum]|uniref:Uncharacterized protein n=1 Tax=Steinernema hermaphroditum TaxID=289476 RepID=A0AA39M4A9_9BILA|nr:hypothetical protein QR680_014483 [Steinernema hermaphroditum]